MKKEKAAPPQITADQKGKKPLNTTVFSDLHVFAVLPAHKTFGFPPSPKSRADPGGLAPGPVPARFFFLIMKFSGYFKQILGSRPPPDKIMLSPHDQNPGSAPGNVTLPLLTCSPHGCWKFPWKRTEAAKHLAFVANQVSSHCHPNTSLRRDPEFWLGGQRSFEPKGDP